MRSALLRFQQGAATLEEGAARHTSCGLGRVIKRVP
jgi:hypothetical protein